MGLEDKFDLIAPLKPYLEVYLEVKEKEDENPLMKVKMEDKEWHPSNMAHYNTRNNRKGLIYIKD